MRISASRSAKGRAPELLALIDAARTDGVDISLDTYPLSRGISTYLHAFLQLDARAARRRRIRAPRSGPARALARRLEDEAPDGFHDIPMDWSVVVVRGSSITQLASAKACGRSTTCASCSPTRALGLVHRAHGQRGERAHDHGSTHMVGGDGILVGDPPHPRGTARSRATSASTCASSASSPGSRPCGR